jgi:hypothetical protein
LVIPMATDLQQQDYIEYTATSPDDWLILVVDPGGLQFDVYMETNLTFNLNNY